MQVFKKLKRWLSRRHTPNRLPIEIGHAMRESDPESSRYGKKIKRTRKRGASERRIIVDVVRDGYRHQYHATKGWRCVKES